MVRYVKLSSLFFIFNLSTVHLQHWLVLYGYADHSCTLHGIWPAQEQLRSYSAGQETLVWNPYFYEHFYADSTLSVKKSTRTKNIDKNVQNDGINRAPCSACHRARNHLSIFKKKKALKLDSKRKNEVHAKEATINSRNHNTYFQLNDF
jgi:hypothetical protein